MKSALDCIPCFVAQGLNVARLATSEQRVHERVLREVLQRASQAELAQPPAQFGRWIHRLVRELTGQPDPYLAIKQQSNRLALELLPGWRERLQTAEDPRQAAVKLALAATVIDFGIKGGPAINDALLADAQVAGLEGLVALMDTGSDGAGIVLDDCSAEFQRRFARADLIIAKGQANFESLDGCGQNIFFLFKVKCPVVARHIGQAIGSLVLHRNVPEAAGRVAAPSPIEAREPNSTTEDNRERKDQVMTPMGDGTGPLGQGPVGKGMGPCGGGQRRGGGGGRGQGSQGRGQGRGRGFGRGRGQGATMQSNPPAANNPNANKPN
jgi:uncharacterized protein with ATP-grasp and redox domains